MAFVAVLDQQRTDVLFEKGGVSCPWALSCTENVLCRTKDDGGHEQRQVMLSAAHGREWRGLRPAEVGLTLKAGFGPMSHHASLWINRTLQGAGRSGE